MKSVILGLMIFSTMICKGQNDENFKKLYWLLGEWNRTNASPGKTGIERWVINSFNEMHGEGISIKGNDTTFTEKLRIIIRGKEIFYVADVPINKKPVFFKLKKLTNNEFLFENNEHDFPKQILYMRDHEKMKVVISGNGKSINYLFEKKL